MECLHFFILKALLNAIAVKYDNIVRISKETLFFFRVAYPLSTISVSTSIFILYCSFNIQVYASNTTPMIVPARLHCAI